MSLSIIAFNKGIMYIASDKRRVDGFNEYKIMDDDVKKIYQLTPSISFMGGGISFQSDAFKVALERHKDEPINKIVELLNNTSRKWEWPGIHSGKCPELPRCSSMFLAGIDNIEHKLFLWQGNEDNSNSFNHIEPHMNGCFIYSYDKKSMEKLYSFYVNENRMGTSVPDAVNKTMLLGHYMQPRFVSKNFDSICYSA